MEYGWKTNLSPDCWDYVRGPVFAALPPPPARILDVGCGNGHLIAELEKFGYEVVGIDPASDSVALARQQTSARIEQEMATPGLLERLGEAPFDVVVSVEVVEHVYDPHAWAAACYGALRPHGILICTTPHHGYVKNLALALTNGFDRHWHPLRVGGHIKFWSKATLRELLEQTGFRVLSLRGLGRIPLLRMSLVAIARRP